MQIPKTTIELQERTCSMCSKLFLRNEDWNKAICPRCWDENYPKLSYLMLTFIFLGGIILWLVLQLLWTIITVKKEARSESWRKLELNKEHLICGAILSAFYYLHARSAEDSFLARNAS